MTRAKRGVVGGLVLGGLGLATLAAGVVVVAPGETAVVRRFGRVLPEPLGPGAHPGWPFGLDRVDRLRPGEVRRVEVGLPGSDAAGPDDDPGAGEYLTGDLNLIRARAVVQYRVADPARFVLAGDDREALLARLSEASLARALSRRGVDAALGEGRAAIAGEVRDDLDRRAVACGLGLAILGVSLTDARPPVEVQPDFAAAQAARSDRDRRATEAASKAETSLIAARAKAAAIMESARAEAARAVTLAEARAARFLALLAEAGRSRRLTVRRLYLDALRELLPRVRRKVLLTPDEPVDLSVFGVEK